MCLKKLSSYSLRGGSAGRRQGRHGGAETSPGEVHETTSAALVELLTPGMTTPDDTCCWGIIERSDEYGIGAETVGGPLRRLAGRFQTDNNRISWIVGQG
jgi:hypothetical protein